MKRVSSFCMWRRTSCGKRNPTPCLANTQLATNAWPARQHSALEPISNCRQMLRRHTAWRVRPSFLARKARPTRLVQLHSQRRPGKQSRRGDSESRQTLALKLRRAEELASCDLARVGTLICVDAAFLLRPSGSDWPFCIVAINPVMRCTTNGSLEGGISRLCGEKMCPKTRPRWPGGRRARKCTRASRQRPPSAKPDGPIY